VAQPNGKHDAKDQADVDNGTFSGTLEDDKENNQEGQK